MTDLEILAQQAGVSERTLRRAVNLGTLKGERVTPRRLTLSASEKQYVRRSWPLLASLREALRTEPNVRFALLYGSAARGEDTTSSDIDLLVEMRNPGFGEVIDLGAKLEEVLGRRVDLLLREEASADPHLLAEAVNDGRVVVDREERWSKLHRRAGSLRQQGRKRDELRKRDALAGIDRMLSA